MDILMIGGTGNISASIPRLLLTRGDRVWLFNRGSRREFEAMGAQYILGDLNDPEGMKRILAGRRFDVVANFFNFTADQCRRDFEIFRGNVAQYIFISSCTVYQKPLKTWPIREDTPLKNPFSEYARNKMASEFYLLERYREDGFPVTIVRPSHTYGETKLVGALLSWQDKQWTLADRILHGEETIVHGEGRTLWTLTHSDDFAAGFVGLMGLESTVGHAFHITSDEAMTWDEIYTTFAHALGVEPNLVHLPVEFIERNWPKFQGAFRGDKGESLVFDNSKLKRYVPGFAAKVPFHEGIRRSIAYHRAHPELMVVDPVYSRETDALIAKYRTLG